MDDLFLRKTTVKPAARTQEGLSKHSPNEPEAGFRTLSGQASLLTLLLRCLLHHKLHFRINFRDDDDVEGLGDDLQDD
jgi:hypothetical protein